MRRGAASLPARPFPRSPSACGRKYEAFATRDLSEMRPLYLFLDGVAERLRPGSAREAVLSAWAIAWEGRKVLIHLSPGTKESTDCCREFLKGHVPPGTL